MRLIKKGLHAYQKELASPSSPAAQLKGGSTNEQLATSSSPNISKKVENSRISSPSVAPVAEKSKPASGLRRSAELLMLMGKEAADEALSHMSVDEIRLVMKEVVKLKEERALAQQQQEEQTISGGIGAARGFLKTVFDDSQSERILRAAVPDLVDKPFAFLDDIPQEQVVALLKEESIEVLAVILPRIKPLLARCVLEAVAPFEQADLVKRIVKLKHVDQIVIMRIEEVLQERLRQTGGPIERDEFDGQQALVEILRHMPSGKERDLLERLSQEEPQTARQIEEQLFTVDALFWLSMRDLQMQLQSKPNSELAMLIKGKSVEVRTLLLNALSKRRAESVLQEEALMGLVAKKEVDKVMRAFLDELRTLEREGRLVLMRPGELFL